MRITTRGRYALRASLAMAVMGKDGYPVSISSLAERENISSVFLEQIFFKLRKAGIVSSIRGPGGGFYFAQPLEQLTLKDILDAAGEELNFTPCDKRKGECDRVGYCLSHAVWQNTTDLINNYFKSITLASILEGGISLEKDSFARDNLE
ncbi:MAG: Rrf2 family transcriptional regulator [Treponema sp.]|nr:Rrf2 family transcriptional regulator [Treponema sp.]